MQILVIGNSPAAKKLAEYLSLAKDDIIFATCDNFKSKKYISVNLNTIKEIEDFISANEVGLCLLFKHFSKDKFEEFTNRSECPLLSFVDTLNSICLNLGTNKKFIYKNKFKTPKFGVFEKPQAALEYIQNAASPVIIAPDANYKEQGFYIAETKDRAKNKIEELFEKGNKKIVLQDYTEGIEYTKYLISDNINTFNFFETLSYFDEFSVNNASYIQEDKKTEIENKIMPDILDVFMEDNIDFHGIIGLKFIISTKGEIFFDRIESFVSELDFEILKNTINCPLKDILYECATGSLNQKSINFNSKYAISAQIKDEITGVSANTYNKALEIIQYEGLDEKNLQEGLKLWKRH